MPLTLPTGLHAYPLTPLRDDRLDEPAFTRLIARLVAAGVDAITVLGSTGAGAYLTREERARVVALAVEAAGDVPVHAGVSALRTSHAIAHAQDAQAAGARAALLAPQSYQPLTEADVLGLYADVTAATDLPVVVYDNPTTTRFAFTPELYGRIAALPGVAGVKIPAVPLDADAARARVSQVRDAVGPEVSIGISGDASAATGLLAGCDTWHSVLGGTLPEAALSITRPARAGDADAAGTASARLQPLWDLMARHGSLRVVAAIAEHLGLTGPHPLPRPLTGLDAAARAEAADVVERLGLSV